MTKPNPFHMTDIANVDRLVDQHADRLRYCADMGRWLTWDGTRWHICPDDAPAWQAAREAIESIRPKEDMAAKHMLRSLSVTRQQAIVTLARRHPALRVDADQLDPDPYALNTPSGVVNLRTGRITKCAPEQLHTKATGCGVTVARGGDIVDLDPWTSRWPDFLHETFGGDEHLIGYMQELAGAAAIGQVQSHTFPFMHGPGGNGKSVLVDVLLSALGDYAGPCPANFLLAGRDKHETEIAQLRGLRLAITSEINPGSTFDEAKVKLLTGGDMLTGRFMRQDFFKFTPSHSLWLVGNHKPEVPAGGTSFWRRLRLIPFTHKVPDDKIIEDLAGKLVAEEGPAILAWIVAGAHRFINCGLSQTPASVAEATGEYANQENPIERFISECCDAVDSNGTAAATMHAAYTQWAKSNGERDMSAVGFGRAMSAAGHKAGKDITSTVRVHHGLRVKQNCLPTWSADYLTANAGSRN